MSTKPRIIVSGAFYQIRSQAAPGIDRFPDNDNKLNKIFHYQLNLLLKKASYELVELTLQHDHYHLVVQASDVTVSWFMRTFNSIFAKQVNLYYKRRGTVFPRRFSSAIIDENYGLEEVACHVHHNTDRLRKKQNDYKEVHLHSEFILRPDRSNFYKEYMKQNGASGRYEEIISALRRANSYGQHYPHPQHGIIGMHAFVSSMLQKHHHRLEQRKVNRERDPQRCIESLRRKLDPLHPFKDTDLLKRGRKNSRSLAREFLVVLGVNLLEFSGADLARYLGITRSAASRMISRCTGNPPRRSAAMRVLDFLIQI
ncbi:MAG: transposase [Fibrobacterota bacterium]